MKWEFRAVYICAFWILGTMGCGGGGGSVTLAIDPANPTVKKGLTQAFTANESQVVWSVDGGAANGSIDSNGVYTAPSTLPLNPMVTVRATHDMETAMAAVHLVTADVVSFPNPPNLVSQDSAHRMFDEGLRNPGAQDRLALANAGSRIDAVWGGASVNDVFFNQQENFAGFGSDRDLTNSADGDLALAVEEDRNDNPLLLFNADSSLINPSRLQMMTSKDGGGTFGTPVMIHPTVPSTDFQFQASLAVDAQNIYHVVFENGPNSGVGFFAIDGTLFYSRSEDGGATWSANPVPIATPPGADDVMADPNLSIDANGNIYVCYSVDPDGSGSGTPFDVFFAKSGDGGATFTAVNLTNSPGLDDTFCRLALGPNGEIYLAYTSGPTPDEADILFQRSLDGGNTFSSPITVNSDTAGLQTSGFISVDPTGRIAAIWVTDTDQDQLPDELMFSRSLDGGASFSPNVKIAGGAPANFVFPMGLRHDSAGRPHLQFASNAQNPGGSADIFYLRGE